MRAVVWQVFLRRPYHRVVCRHLLITKKHLLILRSLIHFILLRLVVVILYLSIFGCNLLVVSWLLLINLAIWILKSAQGTLGTIIIWLRLLFEVRIWICTFFLIVCLFRLLLAIFELVIPLATHTFYLFWSIGNWHLLLLLSHLWSMIMVVVRLSTIILAPGFFHELNEYSSN